MNGVKNYTTFLKHVQIEYKGKLFFHNLCIKLQSFQDPYFFQIMYISLPATKIDAENSGKCRIQKKTNILEILCWRNNKIKFDQIKTK